MSLSPMRAAVAAAALAAAAIFAVPAAALEIEHDLGKTEVPDAPKRIVVLEYSFVDSLAAVGVAPVEPESASTSPIKSTRRSAWSAVSIPKSDQ